jgi:hypothetical protein
MIKKEYEPIIDNLLNKTGTTSISKLFIEAVEEKYKVMLHKDDK